VLIGEIALRMWYFISIYPYMDWSIDFLWTAESLRVTVATQDRVNIGSRCETGSEADPERHTVCVRFDR